jgi:amino-acid N-acetyltransferase
MDYRERIAQPSGIYLNLEQSTFATPIVQGGLFAFQPAPLPALPSDLDGIKVLLAACELPYKDITPGHLENFWVMRDGPRLAGVVGLEMFGALGLLRSLAVPQEDRGRGIGSKLTDKAEEYARAQGVKALYLLTTSAPDFFAKRGYQHADRAAAPAELQETAEFQSLCPEDAVCMLKQLEG